MTNLPTPLYRRIEDALGADLAEWVKAFRDSGKSWAEIRLRLYLATDGKTVSHETLRDWFEPKAEAVS